MAEIIGRVGIRNYVSPIPQASTLINGLIHAWNANGNANDSIGGLNGTLVNGTLADAAPKIGSGAFYFDGINDRITLADNSLNLNTDFTVSFWCKDAVGTNKTIIHNKYFANDANTSGWSIIYNGTGISFDITTAWVSTADIRHLLPNWNHVVVKYTRGVKMEIFLNGVLNATKNTTLTPTYSYTPIKTSIGTWNSVYMINGGPTLYPGTGLLDALNIWNRALTSAEITELYGLTTELQAPTPTYPTSLKFFIDAGNPLSYSGTGTIVADLTGNGNNGTLTNGTSWTSSNNGVFTFDGVNDYIDVASLLPETTLTANDSFSVSVWFNPSTLPGGGANLFGRNNNDWGNQLIRTEGNVIRGGVQAVNQNGLVLTGVTPLSTNQWYMASYTYNGNTKTVNLYLNSSLEATGTNNNMSGNVFNANHVYIGQRANDLFFQGKIGVIKFYLETRTASDILADFNQFKSRYGY